MIVLDLKKRNGAIAMSTIMIVGVIVFEIAIAALLSSYLIGQEGSGLKISSAVSFAARAGANDAIRRVAINNFSTSSYYTFTINNIPVSVFVCKELTYTAGECLSPAIPNKYEIISSASYLNKKNAYKVVISIDANTAQPTVEYFQEVPVN